MLVKTPTLAAIFLRFAFHLTIDCCLLIVFFNKANA